MSTHTIMADVGKSLSQSKGKKNDYDTALQLKRAIEVLEDLYASARDAIMRDIEGQGVEKVITEHAQYAIQERAEWDYKSDEYIPGLEAELAGRRLEYRKLNKPKGTKKILFIKETT